MTLLSPHNIDRLRPEVHLPAYERTNVRIGIVHLGLGAFQRAHQALYTEAVLEAGDLRWGTVGIHLRGRRLADALRDQGCLYSVTERHGDEARTRVVGALLDSIFAPERPVQVLSALADPDVTVITSTVTEKGYGLQPASGNLDLDDPDIQHDLKHPDAPRSTLGVLAAGLRRRAAEAPVTVLCCDNMAANGDTLRRVLMQYAEATGAAELRSRIEAGSIGLPNTMVDRIVPAATDDSLAEAQRLLGLRDEAAIVCEPFTQWVIEDRFMAARPAWERHGALLTSDVRPYQAMKLRLLNGSHSALAYLGQLRGLATVAEATADRLVGPAVRALMTEELLATVTVPPGFDAHRYCQELLHRFENPALAHRTQQIASDGTQKVPVRWLPALRERLAAGQASPWLERALAAWLHYLHIARDDGGRRMTISDPGAEALAARLRGAGDAVAAVRAALGHTAVFGAAPWPEDLTHRLARHLGVLRRGGTEALLSMPRDD
jgi:fructuronate reductase